MCATDYPRGFRELERERAIEEARILGAVTIKEQKNRTSSTADVLAVPIAIDMFSGHMISSANHGTASRGEISMLALPTKRELRMITAVADILSSAMERPDQNPKPRTASSPRSLAEQCNGVPIESNLDRS